jgi:hypothetical protein
MKALIFQTPWTIWRWIRLASGVIFLGSAVFRYDPMIMAVGHSSPTRLFLMRHAVQAGVCMVPGSKTSQVSNKINDQ